MPHRILDPGLFVNHRDERTSLHGHRWSALLVGVGSMSSAMFLGRTADLKTTVGSVAGFAVICALALVLGPYRIGWGWYRLTRNESPRAAASSAQPRHMPCDLTAPHREPEAQPVARLSANVRPWQGLACDPTAWPDNRRLINAQRWCKITGRRKTSEQIFVA